MKKILFAIMLCLSMSAYAQPQRSGFRQLLATGQTSINMRTVTSVLTFDPNAGFNPELIQKYSNERMLDDMRMVFLPYYRPHLSFDDINFILAVLHSPDVRQAIHHLEVINDMNNPERNQYITPAIGKITAGETPEAVKLKEGINQDFLDACKAYYKACGQEEQLKKTRENISKIPNNEEGIKTITKILDYNIENMPNIIANIAFGKIRPDELKLMTAFYETVAFQHLKAGNQALSADTQNVLGKLRQMATEWKTKHEMAQ